MSTHTPGPWFVVGNTVYALNKKNYNRFCAQVQDVHTDAKELLANAQLMATAPDLLAVLQELQESASYWSEYDVPLGIVDRINAAISKAVKS